MIKNNTSARKMERVHILACSRTCMYYKFNKFKPFHKYVFS